MTTIEDIFALPINEVIRDYPHVGKILGDAGIMCVNCMVGTCILSEIFNIHNFPAEQAEVINTRILAVINGKQEINAQPLSASATPSKSPLTYSAPIQRLVDEHVLILRLLDKIPSMLDQMRIITESEAKLLNRVTEFIQQFADRYHHMKEEDILFALFDTTQPIIQSMYQDHEQGREYRQAIQTAVQSGDMENVTLNLLNYRALLTEHIQKEDQLLYPWMDRQLTDSQRQELVQAFFEVEVKEGEKMKPFIQFVVDLN